MNVMQFQIPTSVTEILQSFNTNTQSTDIHWIELTLDKESIALINSSNELQWNTLPSNQARYCN